MTFNWFSTVLIVGIVQCIYLIFNLIAFKKRRVRTNIILASLLAVIAISLTLRISYEYAIYLRYPHISIAGDFVMFLIGPLIYYYTMALLYKDFRFSFNGVVHLVPELIFVASFIYLLTYSPSELLSMSAKRELDTYYFVLLASASVLLLLYTDLSQNLLSAYKRKYFQQASTLPKTRYLQIILVTILVAVLLWFAGILYLNLLDSTSTLMSNIIYQLVFLLIVFLVFVLSYYAMNLPDISIPYLVLKEDKYKRSSLTKIEAISLITRLEVYFDTNRPFLSSDLSLSDVAEAIETNQGYLSRVINENYGKNFFDFVNEYRVKYFINQVMGGSNDHLTFGGIALDCGFGNKGTFYRSFKKITSRTPKEYFKEMSKHEIG